MNHLIVLTMSWFLDLTKIKQFRKIQVLPSKLGFFFLFSLLSFCAFPTKCNSYELSESFSINEKKEEVTLLLHFLFAENELGYTLFGDKPMSFCFLPTRTPFFSTKEHVFKIVKNGSLPLLNAFKMLKSFKKDKNFIFFEKERSGVSEVVFLINKKAFIATFNKNIEVFKKAYGSKITAESFLNDLIHKKSLLNELLFHQHLCMGILLGYGRHNSELFHRREMLTLGRRQIPLTMHPNPSPFFSNVEEEVSFLNRKLRAVSHKNPLYLRVTSVCFAADFELHETLELQSKYKLMHQKLTELFSKDDWVDRILTQLGIKN